MTNVQNPGLDGDVVLIPFGLRPAAISCFDQGFGDLLDALKETSHWDDALIMFLSDN